MRNSKPDTFTNNNLINVLNIKDVPIISRFPIVMNDKDKVKNIKQIESMVRSSMEYREYVKYLKENVDLNKCHFFKRVSNEGRRKISIQIHHEPFTLFDIANTVLTKYMVNQLPIDHFDIAEEIMRLHFQNKVGLIPLSITVHELVHVGKIFIPIQDVYGKNMIKFVKEYQEYMDLDIRKILNTKIENSRDAVNRQNLSILEKRYVYLNVDGFEFPAIEDLKVS